MNTCYYSKVVPAVKCKVREHESIYHSGILFCKLFCTLCDCYTIAILRRRIVLYMLENTENLENCLVPTSYSW